VATKPFPCAESTESFHLRLVERVVSEQRLYAARDHCFDDTERLALIVATTATAAAILRCTDGFSLNNGFLPDLAGPTVATE
jgi:hypothetical protein